MKKNATAGVQRRTTTAEKWIEASTETHAKMLREEVSADIHPLKVSELTLEQNQHVAVGVIGADAV
jgi:hypothetical protein